MEIEIGYNVLYSVNKVNIINGLGEISVNAGGLRQAVATDEIADTSAETWQKGD